MKKNYLTVATGLLAMTISAQQLQQVLILNEGTYGGPVVPASYNPSTKNYSPFDTINARFATDIIVDNGFIYIAADSFLIKYNADTKQKLDETNVFGIRELAIWNNQILVTRGETGTLSSYFQVYDKNTLDLIYEITNISADAAEVKVVGDTAYIAVNDFGQMGKLAVIDLQNQVLNREIDLGADGLNPENVEIGKNGKIYTVNSMDWTNISVTKYDVNTTGFQTIKLGVSGGCSSSALSHIGNIYFQQGDNFNGNTEIMEKNLGVYESSLGFWDTLFINKQIYGMAVDSINGKIYVSETDYFSSGRVFVYDFYGNAVDSFDVGISPGTIFMDVRNATSTDEIIDAKFQIYPNPSDGKYKIQNTKYKIQNIEIYNVLGKKLLSLPIGKGWGGAVDISHQPSGIYFLTLKTDEGIFTEKLIKE